MNKDKKIIIPIKGMHCASCELLIEEELKKIPEITKVNVNHRQSRAEIFYHTQKPNPEEINNAIRQAGYETGATESKSLITRDPDIYKDLGYAFLFLIIFYLIFKSLGLTNFNLATPSSPSEFSVILLVGLTAGLSTCLALVGSIVLGLSATHALQHPEATTWQKFRPHLYFNLGRILSFLVLGGLLGLLGSIIQVNNTIQGILTILVGLIMLLTGLKLTGIFPKLENFNLTLPKQISQFLGIDQKHNQEYSHSNSFWIGALTFFLPCGFTQTMQLLAITSGNFWSGSLVMGIFALGTTVGLLTIAGITSVVTGVFARRFFKFAGLVVILLSLFNISNGFNLTGWKTAFGKSNNITTITDPNVQLVNGQQIVSMEENNSGYSPNRFTIQKDLPVQWKINVKAPNSCAISLIVPDYKIQKTLSAGENIIEFTPTKTGRIPFSCAMGMYTGYFDVVDQNSSSVSTSSTSNITNLPTSVSSCKLNASNSSNGKCGESGNGGCGGCGSGSNYQPDSQPTTPTSDSGNEQQIIKTTYTVQQDIQPNEFTVKVNQPVRLEIDVKENGGGCMGTITIPGLYNQAKSLKKGSLVIEFTPTKIGNYAITCAMGVKRGNIKVQ